MKHIGSWFENVSSLIDDYSRSLNRKLNELHMSLQRPKIPIIGMSSGIQQHPFHRNVMGLHEQPKAYQKNFGYKIPLETSGIQ